MHIFTDANSLLLEIDTTSDRVEEAEFAFLNGDHNAAADPPQPGVAESTSGLIDVPFPLVSKIGQNTSERSVCLEGPVFVVHLAAVSADDVARHLLAADGDINFCTGQRFIRHCGNVNTRKC